MDNIFFSDLWRRRVLFLQLLVLVTNSLVELRNDGQGLPLSLVWNPPSFNVPFRRLVLCSQCVVFVTRRKKSGGNKL